ncbi:hypothetical protein JJD61_13630 [Pseudomonas carnis]|uniref:colicin-like pore-forming protein n=1 Tax=Pseudomonas carnis TaxID=2487355 RepID=UPI00190BFF9D|nr:colicin-like pore-forming protein [Pseudomonas carnis]MBK3471732.1 hypothetical protein [Pseudomonas carnis]
MSGSGAPGDPIQLGITEIRAYQETTFGAGPVGGGGYDDINRNPEMRKIAANLGKAISSMYASQITTAVSDKEKEYIAMRQLIPTQVQQKIEEDKRQSNVPPQDRVANLSSEIVTLEKMISQTSLSIVSLQAIANSFYSGDFFGRPVNSFLKEATARAAYHEANPNVSYDNWQKSLQAAYQVKRLSDLADVATRQKEKVKVEVADIETAIKSTAAFHKEVAEKFGEKASDLAQNLAESAKGNKIRSAEEAFKAFEQYKDAMNKKFSAHDRMAAMKYIDAMDYSAIGKAAARFSKGFGYVGPAMDLKDLFVEYNKSMTSDDWKPFFVKLESIALGLAATALVASVFGFIAVTPLGILVFATMISATGAAVNDILTQQINDFIFSL